MSSKDTPLSDGLTSSALPKELGRVISSESPIEQLSTLYPPLKKYCPLLPTLSQQQILLLGYSGREALYGGAVGGGKSAGLLTAALRFVDRTGFHALLLRRTYAELAKGDGLIPLAHEWLGGTDARWNEQRKTWLFPSGATIEFGHVQHEQDKHSYQGAAYQFVGFDELTHFTESIYLYIGFSRQRRRMSLKDIPVQTFASANPGGVGHLWVRHRFIDNRNPGVLFMPATIRDNPGLDVVDYELSLNHLPEALRQQLMDGDWGAFEGAAYSLDDRIHLVPLFKCPPEWERFEFMDHGTRNPSAWYLCASDYDGNLLVLDEYYQGNALISDHCREILARRGQWYPEWMDPDGRLMRAHPRTIADPSVTTSLGMLSSKQGIPATIATEYQDQSDERIVLIPGNNDRAAGKARVQELLRCDSQRLFPEWHPLRGTRGAPRLFIVGQRCPELVDQLKAAPILSTESGRKGAGEIVDPDWETAYGHAHAALRYGMMSRPDPSKELEYPTDDLRLEFLKKVEARWESGAGSRPRLINV